MEAYDIRDLRGYLQSVRGETRIKATEEGIRNTFLQEAVKEIFTEHDWTFNKRTIEIDGDEDGFVTPKDFSGLNDFWLVAGKTTYRRDQLTLEMTNTGKWVIKGPSEANGILHYYRKAPELVDTTERVYFPQPLLIAERAYVRLKTAYFPDEDSDKELARSKAALRELFRGNAPRQNFTHPALR